MNEQEALLLNLQAPCTHVFRFRLICLYQSYTSADKHRYSVASGVSENLRLEPS